jgi:uncharacterized protein (DUF362 family)
MNSSKEATPMKEPESRSMTRRQLVQGAAAAAGLGVVGTALPVLEARAESAGSLVAAPPAGFVPWYVPGKVTQVTAKGDLKATMQPNQLWPKLEVARRLLEKAMTTFTGAPNVVEAMKRFIHPSDTVAIKPNGIGAKTGATFGTNYELVLAVVEAVIKVGVPPAKINVFEQYPTYLQGCRINAGKWKLPEGVRSETHNNNKMGTPDLLIYQGIKTRYCRALTEATAVINMPLIKDHGVCGYTGALKNITHGCTSNPSDFHAHMASPQIALLYNHPVVRSRVRLHITDGFKLMYDGGPLDRNKRAQILHGSVYVATDPVALDAVGTKLVEDLRTSHGMPNFAKSMREPRYIKTAGELGVGVFDLNQIRMQSVQL